MYLRDLLTYSTILLVLFLAPIPAHPQSINDVRLSNPEGRHTISGRVFSPGGKPAGKGLMVKVSKWGDDIIAWTDDDGEFRVSGVGNGTYSIAASPEGDYESDSQRVVITLEQNSPPQIFNVDLQLRLVQGTKSKTGVVDAELASAPKKAQQHYASAKTALAGGDAKTAIAELLLAVEEHPSFSLAHLELAEIYQRTNELERADEHLQKAIKLKPGSYEPLAARGVILARSKKFVEAESVLREALKIGDSSPVVRLYLGRTLVGLKRPAEAEPEFRAAIAMGGNSMNEARRALANIYLERPDNEKALAEIIAYLEVNPAPADEAKLRETAQWLRDWLKENCKP